MFSEIQSKSFKNYILEFPTKKLKITLLFEIQNKSYENYISEIQNKSGFIQFYFSKYYFSIVFKIFSLKSEQNIQKKVEFSNRLL